MDYQTLWNVIQNNARHIEVINREMGSVQQSVEWLTWMTRFIFVGIVLTTANGLVNTFLLRRNGKNNVQHK